MPDGAVYDKEGFLAFNDIKTYTSSGNTTFKVSVYSKNFAVTTGDMSSAGTFVMGSPSFEEGRWIEEGPQTTVTITKQFWLGATKVTQNQWEAIIRNNPSWSKGDGLPVETVENG